MEKREKKRIIIQETPEGLSKSNIPAEASQIKQVVVLAPEGTKSAANILESVHLETSRILIRARQQGLTREDRQALTDYAKILVAFSKEEREARLMNDLGNLTDDQLFSLIKSMGVKDEE